LRQLERTARKAAATSERAQQLQAVLVETC
jgi:hypothetical protein